ncbi:hypothetical protein LC040_03275 [Bacillus tianshenii]|nr:hypothetical protein LC040_03275 [Bacillus tianshenii]
MKVILAPGIRLIEKLKYSGKFLLIGFFMLIPIAFMLFMLISQTNHDIQFAKKEQVGAEYNREAKVFLQYVQQHRGDVTRLFIWRPIVQAANARQAKADSRANQYH